MSVGTPLQKNRTLIVKSQLSLAATFVLLATIGTLSWLESRSGPPKAVTGTDNVLETRIHIQAVYAAVCAYMQSHEARALDRVRDEGKQVSAYVEELNAQLKKSGKQDLAANIDNAHQALRDASIKLMEAELETSFARREMASATQSLQTTLSKSNQRFSRKTALPRSQVDLYLDQSRALEKAELKSQQALDRFTHRKEALEKAIAAGKQVRFTAQKNLALPLLITLLVFALGLHAFFSYVRTRASIVGPLNEILKCVDAAATGDVSRVPDFWAADEVGRLSQAVGRLIHVLAKSENLVYHLASLVESSGDAIISHNLDGKILSWNKGAQRIYGYSAEEVKGRSIDMLITEEGRAGLVVMLMRIRKGEKVLPFETLHAAKNGRHIQAFVHVAPIYDSTRQVIGASFIAEEIEPAKHAGKASARAA